MDHFLLLIHLAISSHFSFFLVLERAKAVSFKLFFILLKRSKRFAMKKTTNSERGQALVIVALALIGLIGITGLAIDGSMALADRRHAQNAADTAVLAGALTYIQECGKTGCDEAAEIASAQVAMQVAALDRAGSNGYTGDLIHSEVEVHTCDNAGASCEAPYAGDGNYLQVVIISHLKTTFAGVIGIPQIHNRVQAVALADDDDTGPLYDGNAIVALAPTGKGCDGEFIVGGSGTVTIVGGGMFVNSDNTADDLDSTTCGAFKQDGCKTTLDFVDGGGITSVGNINLNKSCLGNLEGPMVEGASPVDFPPDITINAPGECDIAGTVTNDKKTKTSTLSPGSYNNIPPKNATQDNIVMQSGNYCVDDFKVSSKVNVSGTNVFVYIRPGGTFDFSGGVMTLDAPDSGEYSGYLTYVAPPASGFTDCKITGNSDTRFTGTIFAPYCDITINGSSDPDGVHAQIIGYTVKLDGDNDLYIEYDPGENAEDIQPPLIGLAR
jgi:hypothetical protein